MSTRDLPERPSPWPWRTATVRGSVGAVVLPVVVRLATAGPARLLGL